MAHPHADGGTAVFNGLIQYVGGTYRVSHPSSRIQFVDWRANMPVPPDRFLTQPLAEMATAAYGNTAYAVGGESLKGPSALIYRWRLGKSPVAWVRLPHPLVHPMAAIYRQALWVIGGLSPTGFSSAVDSVNLKTGTISPLGRFPVAIAHAAVAVFGHQLWVIGGETARGPSRRSWVWQGHGWRQGPDLPQAVQGDSAFVLGDQLWAGGGSTRSGRITNQLWRYQAPEPVKRSGKSKASVHP